MAPMCVACRSLPGVFSRLFVLLCFMFVILRNVSSLLTYDRQTLLDIKHTTEELLNHVQSGTQFVPPPSLTAIPDYLCRALCPLPGRRRRRRRGRRGGVAVRLGLFLSSRSGSLFGVGLNAYGARFNRFLVRRSLEPAYMWILPIVSDRPDQPPMFRSPCLRRGGVCSSHLRSLRRTPQSTVDSLQIRMALINARSMVNKTFILNDFFTSRDLDFLLLLKLGLLRGI